MRNPPKIIHIKPPTSNNSPIVVNQLINQLVLDLVPGVREMEDPFEIVKEETEAAIADIYKNLERWKKLASGTSSVAIQERNSVKCKSSQILN